MSSSLHLRVTDIPLNMQDSIFLPLPAQFDYPCSTVRSKQSSAAGVGLLAPSRWPSPLVLPKSPSPHHSSRSTKPLDRDVPRPKKRKTSDPCHTGFRSKLFNLFEKRNHMKREETTTTRSISKGSLKMMRSSSTSGLRKHLHFPNKRLYEFQTVSPTNESRLFA